MINQLIERGMLNQLIMIYLQSLFNEVFFGNYLIHIEINLDQNTTFYSKEIYIIETKICMDLLQ